MKIKRNDWYYIFVGLMIFTFYTRFFSTNDTVDYLLYAIIFIALGCFGIYWIMVRENMIKRVFKIITLIFFVGIYFLTKMQYEYLILTALAIIGMKDKSFKIIMRIFYKVYGICLLMHLFMLLTGILQDNVYSKISSGKIINVHSLGFATGNTFYAILFILYVSLIYVKRDKINYVYLIGLEILNIIIYFLSYSRTGFITITVLIIVTLVTKYIKINFNKIKPIIWIDIFILPELFIFTYLNSTIYYGTRIQSLLDHIVSSRLTIGKFYLTIFPVKLFQNSFNLIGDLPIDNLYIFVLCAFGLFFAILICVAYTLLMIKLYKKRRYYEMFIITLVALYAYSEKFFINAFRNPTIFLIEMAFNKNSKILDEIKKDDWEEK